MKSEIEHLLAYDHFGGILSKLIWRPAFSAAGNRSLCFNCGRQNGKGGDVKLNINSNQFYGAVRHLQTKLSMGNEKI